MNTAANDSECFAFAAYLLTCWHEEPPVRRRQLQQSWPDVHLKNHFMEMRKKTKKSSDLEKDILYKSLWFVPVLLTKLVGKRHTVLLIDLL